MRESKRKSAMTRLDLLHCRTYGDCVVWTYERIVADGNSVRFGWSGQAGPRSYFESSRKDAEDELDVLALRAAMVKLGCQSGRIRD